MQVQKTGTLKQCPGKVILEFELITTAVHRGVEGKIFKVFALSLIEDIDSSINKSIHSSLDHHKILLCLVFD